MSKWADYLITKVRYSAAGLHIERVMVQEDLGDSLGPSKELSRAEVVKLMQANKSFVTAPPSRTNPGKVDKGASVSMYPVETLFIKSKADKSERDNLENLPQF